MPTGKHGLVNPIMAAGASGFADIGRRLGIQQMVHTVSAGPSQCECRLARVSLLQERPAQKPRSFEIWSGIPHEVQSTTCLARSFQLQEVSSQEL